MIIVMNENATKENINNIVTVLKNHKLDAHISQGYNTTIIGIVGNKELLNNFNIELMDGVRKCVPIMHSYKLASREMQPSGRQVKIKDVVIGSNQIVMMAGPCAVENEEQIFNVAKAIKETGTQFLRGGAFKPRTSPYAFQGLEMEGLKILKRAAESNGLKVISEITSENQIEQAINYCDIFQIGARNMQNFKLLKAVGQSMVPVLLKRGIASTIEEWLDAAEYIMKEGNYNVILCERGIRTFETATRNTLDISSIAVVKEKSSLPIIVDPSHAAGKSAYIKSLSLAAIAAGADGLIIEVHPNPKVAISDSAQQLTPEAYSKLHDDIKKVAYAINRTL